MPVPGGLQLTGKDLTSFVAQLDSEDRARIFAVVGTSGTTNLGIIDDLEGIADVCSANDWWMHVDGAYGGAGLAAPSARPSLTALSELTASLSILISGSLPPLTAAHCYTEIQSTREPPTGSMVNTWRCCMTASGIPLITPITYPAGLEAYPFGSALQRTGPKPTATPLRPRSARHTQPHGSLRITQIADCSPVRIYPSSSSREPVGPAPTMMHGVRNSWPLARDLSSPRALKANPRCAFASSTRTRRKQTSPKSWTRCDWDGWVIAANPSKNGRGSSQHSTSTYRSNRPNILKRSRCPSESVLA